MLVACHVDFMRWKKAILLIYVISLPRVSASVDIDSGLNLRRVNHICHFLLTFSIINYKSCEVFILIGYCGSLT